MNSHQHGPGCGCKEFLFNELSDDLFGSIDLQGVECLNEVSVGSVRKIFRPELEKLKKDYHIESDIDSEILVIIPFNETVRIKVINIIAFDELSAPNKLKAYINRENVDFELAQEEPDQEFFIAPNLSGEYGNATKLTKFENVNQLVLYFHSTINDPIKISYIGLKGVRTEMKRRLVNTTYELNPLPREIDPTKQTQEQNVF